MWIVLWRTSKGGRGWLDCESVEEVKALLSELFEEQEDPITVDDIWIYPPEADEKCLSYDEFME